MHICDLLKSWNSVFRAGTIVTWLAKNHVKCTHAHTWTTHTHKCVPHTPCNNTPPHPPPQRSSWHTFSKIQLDFWTQNNPSQMSLHSEGTPVMRSANPGHLPDSDHWARQTCRRTGPCCPSQGTNCRVKDHDPIGWDRIVLCTGGAITDPLQT